MLWLLNICFSGAAPVKVRKEFCRRTCPSFLQFFASSGAAPVKVRKGYWESMSEDANQGASVGPHP